MTITTTENRPVTIMMPTKDSETFVFMFACPKCDYEIEETITLVVQRDVLKTMALSHYVSHNRP